MADLKPPFTQETANKKVKFAQDLWNTKDYNVVYKGRVFYNIIAK